MKIIASNITTRNRKVSNSLKPSAKEGSRAADEEELFISSLARECVAAGANALDINLQQHYDQPEVMRQAVSAVQKATAAQLCLSCRSPETLEAGLRECCQPAIVNYVSLDSGRLEQLLPLAAKYGTEVVLLTADPVPPAELEDALKSAAVLIGAANEAGIPNERIMVDPGVLHVTYSAGQRQLGALMELIPAIGEAFEPRVRTACWVNNVSAGAARRLRPVIDSTFFAMLTGLGLSCAFVDVLEPQIARTMRLTRAFRNELVYSDGEIDRRAG